GKPSYRSRRTSSGGSSSCASGRGSAASRAPGAARRKRGGVERTPSAVGVDGEAGADEVLVAVGGVDAADGRPVLGLPEAGDRVGRQLAAVGPVPGVGDD